MEKGVPSVPRGFKLQNFRPAFGGDHRGTQGPSQTALPPFMIHPWLGPRWVGYQTVDADMGPSADADADPDTSGSHAADTQSVGTRTDPKLGAHSDIGAGTTRGTGTGTRVRPGRAFPVERALGDPLGTESTLARWAKCPPFSPFFVPVLRTPKKAGGMATPTRGAPRRQRLGSLGWRRE